VNREPQGEIAIKSLACRALVYEQLERFEESLADFMSVLTLQPTMELVRQTHLN
jgi:hypothetical protein